MRLLWTAALGAAPYKPPYEPYLPNNVPRTAGTGGVGCVGDTHSMGWLTKSHKMPQLQLLGTGQGPAGPPGRCQAYPGFRVEAYGQFSS